MRQHLLVREWKYGGDSAQALPVQIPGLSRSFCSANFASFFFFAKQYKTLRESWFIFWKMFIILSTFYQLLFSYEQMVFIFNFF